MKGILRPLRPVIILFIILTAIFIAAKSMLARYGINNEVLIIGNLVLLIATTLSFLISYKNLRSPNPNAAVRSMYGSFMVKFFICLIAAFAYVMIKRKEVDKYALFICMGLYLVYTFMEVGILTKLLKEKKNA